MVRGERAKERKRKLTAQKEVSSFQPGMGKKGERGQPFLE